MMQIETVPIATIEVPSVRITNYMTEEVASLFALTIQTAGVLQPIHCIRQNGRLLLVDGLHRLQEAQARGDTEINAVIVEGSLQDVLLQNLATSVARGKPKHSDVRRVIQALEEEFQLDSIGIRKKTGLPQDYIENLMWVNRATPLVQEALDEGKIGLGHAVLLARLPSQEAQDILVMDCIARSWTIPYLREVIKQAETWNAQPTAEQPAAATSPAMKYTCQFCGVEHEPSATLIAPICPRCRGLAWAAIQSQPSPPP